MAESVYPGTVITWLPEWIAFGWRALLWLAIVYLIARMTLRAIRGDAPMLAYGRAALVLFLVQELITDAERYHDPITYEGVPIVTVAVFFAWRAMLVAPPPELASGSP